jgi:hypothetical protein
MPAAPWQKYHPPAGALGTGPVGVGNGGFVATASAVASDGDGLGIPFDATPGDALGKFVDAPGLGNTPELAAADRWRPWPTAKPTTANTTTTATADPTATSQGRDEFGCLGSSIKVHLRLPNLAFSTPTTFSWFRV